MQARSACAVLRGAIRRARHLGQRQRMLARRKGPTGEEGVIVSYDALIRSPRRRFLNPPASGGALARCWRRMRDVVVGAGVAGASS
jgi:hypothetical protein